MGLQSHSHAVGNVRHHSHQFKLLSHEIGTFTTVGIAFDGIHVESHGTVSELLIQVFPTL